MTVSERIAQLQDRAPAIPRLGLPAYNWWNEGLHGIARNGYATVFPQAIGLAATWDPALLHAVGQTVSTEARAKFNPHRGQDSPRYAGLTLWSPNINIFRDPRWGRGQETYGEDPFLTAALGSSFVEGIQGDDAFYRRADATPKHFAAHSGPEEGRDSFNAVVSPHDLTDTYLHAFHTLMTDAHADALMCSYNAIDGMPSCANPLLQDTVRTSWNFTGYIVSDCDAVGNLTEYHHFTTDRAHGAAAALNAGVDLDCGHSYLPLKDALAQHLTTQATVDRALHRLLSARVHLGLLDPVGCSPFDRIAGRDNDTPQHRALALRAAEESMVLLHNDGVLPLKSTERIAVIGPNADALNVLEANYHGTASHPVTQLSGLLAALPKLTYAQGSLLAEGIAAPVPRTALRTTAAADAQPGLLAEYFDNVAFSGTSRAATVANVDLDLDRVGPSEQVHTAQYSARWTGVLLPPAPGDYTLHVAIERCWDCSVHDHFRLYIDNALAIENNGDAPEPSSFTLHAVDNRPHSLRLELAHAGDDEGISLQWIPPATALLQEALRMAKDADTIVAVVGLSPQLEGEALPVHLEGFNSGDRTSLDLPAPQRDLLRQLQELHKRLIIILNSGSAVALDPKEYAADALLEAWYPGEEGGTALANILTGTVSPSGRLPVTFYRSVADLPPFTDYSMAHRTYRYFEGPVLYPFGFGLSYSQFRYDAVQLSKQTACAADTLTASVVVRNAGQRSAPEVTELYIAPPHADGAPRLSLAGIQRVQLASGESRTMIFNLKAAQLATVDSEGHSSVLPGSYRIFLGGAQPNPDGSPAATLSVLTCPRH